MDDKKIAIIVHSTDEKNLEVTLNSLRTLEVPPQFSLDVLPVQGEEKFQAYNIAMKESDAKYKIYLDENVSILRKNILSEIISVFKSDKKIGAVGLSGAIQLSTHGICFNSAKRCGKISIGANKKLQDWGDDKRKFMNVEAVDSFFIATQYDIDWREDLKDFSVTAQCLNLKREGYQSVVIRQKKACAWVRQDNFEVDAEAQKIFLEDYKFFFPLVSIIIPTFNRPKYFQEALESALNQTYRNFEIFITDNSTEDDTENLMKDYLQKYSNIKYVRYKDFTANDNWDSARKYNNPDAEFVNYLLDDDLFYPKKLEVMVEVFRNNPKVSVVTSIRNTIDKDGNITGKMLMPRPEVLNNDVLLKGEDAGTLMFSTGQNYVGEPTTALIRKKCLRDNDLCWTDNESGFFSLIDISTWLQLFEKGDLFYIANESLSAFRKHEEQTTNLDGSMGAIFEISWALIFKTAWEKKFIIKNERQMRERVLNWIYSACARLTTANQNNYHDEAIVTLEKTMHAMIQSLYNGYKIDLPPRDYGEKTKQGRIS